MENEFELTVEHGGESRRYFGSVTKANMTDSEGTWLMRTVWLSPKDPRKVGIFQFDAGLHLDMSSDDKREIFWITRVSDKTGGELIRNGALEALLRHQHDELKAVLRSMKIEDLSDEVKAVWQALEAAGVAEQTEAEGEPGVTWRIWHMPR